MNIVVEGELGEESVERYVQRHMGAYADGQLEAVAEEGRNVCHAFGRLVEVLADKGLLTLEDVKAVAGGYKNIEKAA